MEICLSASCRRVALTLSCFALLAGVTATGGPVAAAAEEEPVFRFAGGGYGHGVGMSQYGALGRAEAGFPHVEILRFYYPGAEAVHAPELVVDDVDVRIAVHSTTVFTPTGQLTVAMDGSFLDTTVNRLTVRRGDGGWHINSSNIDWCRGFCPGTALTVSFGDGEPVRVSNTENHVRRYAHGQFQLTPADSGAANCGSASARQYCLVIGDLTMRQYLHGLAEVPSSWHAEALKAQAVAARSYAAAKMRERAGWSAPFDLYSTHKDQTYRAWDKQSSDVRRFWADAVDSTEDVVLVYTPEAGEDEPTPDPLVATAFYTTANGGYVAAPEEPWSRPLPYLAATPDEHDAAPDENGEPQNPFHRWVRTYTRAEVSRWLAEYTIADLDVGDVSDIRIEAVGPSGRIDDALVTLVGSKRTLEVRKANGTPYGYRFYYAVLQGCRRTPGCKPTLSTMVVVTSGASDAGSDDGDAGDDSSSGDAGDDGSSGGDDGDDGSSGGDDGDAQPPGVGIPPSTGRFNVNLIPGDDYINGRYAAGTLPFADVDADAPYAEAVAWMLNAGITSGTSETTFSPDDPITRVQFAAFLWRFAGRPASTEEAAFTDLPGGSDSGDDDGGGGGGDGSSGDSGDDDGGGGEDGSSGDSGDDDGGGTGSHGTGGHGTDGDVGTGDSGDDGGGSGDDGGGSSDIGGDSSAAVNWMAGNRITSGCGADPLRFCPHEALTAAHVVTFLWRFAGSTLASDESIMFVDVEVDSYFLEPIRWMLRWGLWVNEDFDEPSYLDFFLRPHDPVSRAHIAVYLWNLAGQPGAFTPPGYLPPFLR